MIILRLKGGLGNQMFQYALGRVLSIKNNTELVCNTEAYRDETPLSFKNNMPVSYNLDAFNTVCRIANKQEIPLLYRMYGKGKLASIFDAIRIRIFRHRAQELNFEKFNPRLLSLGDGTYLDGYFQSPKYFMDYADVIRKDFTLKMVSEKFSNLAKEIKSKNSVCVHIRRGDYVTLDFHPVLLNDYYNKALALISESKKIDCVYVFDRDDIEWCKENIHFNYPTVYVDNDISIQESLVLMSECKDFIIANSSFSWWAAWLNTNRDKIVIAPRKWFADESVDTSDLIPEDWIRI